MPTSEALLSFEAASCDRAFENLFAEHHPRLVRTLLRLVGNPALAEELAAEAFYRLYLRSERNGLQENPAGWLYRTAMNLGLDALRANSRRTRREERVTKENLMNETPENPLSDLLAEERRDRVRTVIARLKPIHGQVLIMGCGGYSRREIASVLGIKSSSLYVLTAPAKAQFERNYLRLYGRAE